MPPSSNIRRRCSGTVVSPIRPYSSSRRTRSAGAAAAPEADDLHLASCRVSSAISPNNNGSNSHVRVLARIRPLNDAEAGCDLLVFPQDELAEEPTRPAFPRSTNTASAAATERTAPFPFSSLIQDTTKPSSNSSPAPAALTPAFPYSQAPNFTNLTPAFASIAPASVAPASLGSNSTFSKTVIAQVSETYHKTFDLDGVLGPAVTQKDVYDQTVGKNIQQNVLRGYNTTIIAYGQTGSGKTYTMSGPSSSQSTEEEETCGSIRHGVIADDSGVIPRAIHEVFEVKRSASASNGAAVEIRLLCLEIYKDEIRDLLAEEDAPQQQVVLRDYGDEQGVSVQGVQAVRVESMEQVQELMELATRQRTTGPTRLNEHSSRSHAVYTLEVTILQQSPSAAAASQNPLSLRQQQQHPVVMRSKLTLVDLAGSERLKASGVDGVQKQESIHINTDLFVLGKVVSALAGKQQQQAVHVPYRDSKLTRLLRDSLGGNCFTILIACVKPLDVDESVNTLRYAERARAITNSFKPNIISSSNRMSPSECMSMRAENKRLKAQLHEMQELLRLQLLQVPETNHEDTQDAEDSVVTSNRSILVEGTNVLSTKEMAHAEAQESAVAQFTEGDGQRRLRDRVAETPRSLSPERTDYHANLEETLQKQLEEERVSHVSRLLNLEKQLALERNKSKELDRRCNDLTSAVQSLTMENSALVRQSDGLQDTMKGQKVEIEKSLVKEEEQQQSLQAIKEDVDAEEEEEQGETLGNTKKSHQACVPFKVPVMVDAVANTPAVAAAKAAGTRETPRGCSTGLSNSAVLQQMPAVVQTDSDTKKKNSVKNMLQWTNRTMSEAFKCPAVGAVVASPAAHSPRAAKSDKGSRTITSNNSNNKRGGGGGGRRNRLRRGNRTRRQRRIPPAKGEEHTHPRVRPDGTQVVHGDGSVVFDFWCRRCRLWNGSHTTSQHKTKKERRMEQQQQQQRLEGGNYAGSGSNRKINSNPFAVALNMTKQERQDSKRDLEIKQHVPVTSITTRPFPGPSNSNQLSTPALTCVECTDQQT